MRRRWSAGWVALITAMLLPLGVLGWLSARAAGESDRSQAQIARVVAGGCLYWGDFAQYAADLPKQPPISPLGLRILADAWPAYDTHLCPARYGPLPAPPVWLASEVARAYKRAAVQAGQTPASEGGR